ncbi:suppressor of cytokine signaling 7-like isoform X1 [Myxocyprinus asiaticus]|uniref:suppressor of cytokine signaling 7-like isoform X1 n=1 Tax=Myxocyprinus asiaticus TaxID=70543 RepID=UPI0022220C6D|nr:suppressor of cytokine signaling 7-like isoform X1 [Myxocyprinus asiaticus]
MNNAQDMSPDFVLMRLVSAAEDDRLDEENGNLSSTVQEVLAHGGIKGNFECTQNQMVGLARHGHISAVNKAPQASGTEAPDTGVMATRPSLSVPPPALHSTEAHGYDLTHRGGIGPQLLVFRNISRDSAENNSDDQRQVRAFEDQAVLASESSGSINNNMFSAVDAQHPPTWTLHPQHKLPTVAADTEAAELCHRHRLITDKKDWLPVADKTNAVSVTEPGWSCTTAQRQLQLPDGPVLELARKFGELGVAPVTEFLLKDGELPHCSCQSVLGSAGIRQGEDPTETSDALLVLEGLGSEEVNGLGINTCQKTESHNLEHGQRDMVNTMPGAFTLKCFPSVLSGQAMGVSRGLCSPACSESRLCCLLRDSVNTRAQGDTTTDKLTPEVLSPPSEPSQDTPCSSQASTPKSRADRSASRAHGASVGEKTLKVPGKSRKGSLKIRLSKLFRTKSCSGSNNILDKRPSVTFSISSAGSLVDMSGQSGGAEDAGSQPGLTRAQSAFSAATFAPFFTGETVSLVDVDISQRERNSPHPPTPPPPPRRSLSLLDDIGGPQPGPFLVSVMGASLQSLPLPLPPPPPLHATIQHSLSLNDAFFRALPHSAPSPMETQAPARVAPPPIICPLRGADSSSFTASLRELERCGWYWGPMNWEDAEMKLRGKPDGSFLVRDSSDPRYILSLSFRSQGVTHHTRMEHYRGTFSLWCHPKFEDRCHSVVEFIERAIMHSKNGKFLYFLRSRVPGLPPTPVQLLYPVSRFSNVKSLQHLCRFCIRQLVRIDHIQELPLPKPLIVYLRKFYYYDPEEEMYLSIKGMRQAAGVEQEAESET